MKRPKLIEIPELKLLVRTWPDGWVGAYLESDGELSGDVIDGKTGKIRRDPPEQGGTP